MLLPVRHFALMVAALMLASCDTKASRVEKAYAEYQAGAASGDLRMARYGLLKLVAADEDVADYWVELGKVQFALGAYSDSYRAFSRALELDRDNPETLSVLTQVALRNGEIEIAEEYAQQLEMIVPNDVSVKLTYGIIALRRGDFKTANERAEQILASQPNSSDAKVLQSQILVQAGRLNDAITLLAAHVRVRPKDVGGLRGLASLYQQAGDTQKAAATRKAIWNLDPGDSEVGIGYVEAAFVAGDIVAARAASLTMMKPEAPTAVIETLLDRWRQLWPGPARLDEARRLARSANPEQKLAYAAFFNELGSPADALSLIAATARLPVTSDNIAPNNIMAMTLFLSGDHGAAQRRVDAILKLDGDNVEALRTRAELNLIRKQSTSAINDARKVVSLSPTTASDRVLLARTHVANDDPRAAGRVLWEAFRDLPANPLIYATLRKFLARSNDIDAIRKLDREFADQRQAVFKKEFT